ncbi:NAD-dependent malate dehydrogenase [Scenedesmus sp. NREL 46B-D3]|nr:NAD-dependent malate dehydrogenase [Scenedesmus sp. NREL 46B-D3]
MQMSAGQTTRASAFTGQRVGVHAVARPGAAKARRTMPVVEAKRVAVLGAAGGIGQPLSLLLKMNKCVTELALFDVAPLVKGVAADLSHCNTPVQVSAHVGDAELEACLKGCELVVIPAGVPRKPGMTRDDLFNINAGIVMNLVTACAKYCPNAILEIISNPVNSTVPIASEVLKAAGVYNPRKLLGVTTLDVVRANTFVAQAKGLDLKEVDVPVIGGHAGATILPLLSQTVPSVSFSDAERKALTTRIQEAGTEVVEAKAGAGSATLSMAYAAARMAESTLLGMQGEPNMYECAYVQSDVVPGAPFFASHVQLGPEGVAKVNGLGQLNEFEKAALDAMLPELKSQIEKGLAFAKNPPKKE